MTNSFSLLQADNQENLQRLSKMYITMLGKSKDGNNADLIYEAMGKAALGMEMGLAPMAAMRNIHVINGVPSLSAQAMHGLVKQYDPKNKISISYTGQAEDLTAKIKAVDAESGSVFENELSIAAARKRGLTSTSKGEKSIWKQHGESMLAARLVSQACRILWPHIINGMCVHSQDGGGKVVDSEVVDTEELEEASPAPVTKSKPKTTPKLTATPKAEDKLVDTPEEKEQLKEILDRVKSPASSVKVASVKQTEPAQKAMDVDVSDDEEGAFE